MFVLPGTSDSRLSINYIYDEVMLPIACLFPWPNLADEPDEGLRLLPLRASVDCSDSPDIPVLLSPPFSLREETSSPLRPPPWPGRFSVG